MECHLLGKISQRLSRRNDDLTFRGRHHTGYDPEQGRLPAAVLSDKTDPVTGIDDEGSAFKKGLASKLNRYILN